jgi:hypothetical protein
MTVELTKEFILPEADYEVRIYNANREVLERPVYQFS